MTLLPHPSFKWMIFGQSFGQSCDNHDFCEQSNSSWGNFFEVWQISKPEDSRAIITKNHDSQRLHNFWGDYSRSGSRRRTLTLALKIRRKVVWAQTCELGQVKIWYFVYILLKVYGMGLAPYCYMYCFLQLGLPVAGGEAPMHVYAAGWHFHCMYLGAPFTHKIIFLYNYIYNRKYQTLTCPSSQVWPQTTFRRILSATFKVRLRDPEYFDRPIMSAGVPS